MDELILRSLHASISEEEKRELAEWRRASDENEAYYRDLRDMLDVAGSTLDESSVPPRPPLEALVAGVGSGAGRIEFAAGSKARGRRVAIRVVAGLGLAAALAALLLRGPEPAEAPGFALGEAEYVTGPGETRTVLLPDHSVVKLGPSTRLHTTAAGGLRDVSLDGKAFFAVAKMNGLPFQVRTASGRAIVHGTQFELSTEDAGARLLVFEGQVALEASANESVEVRAGEVSSISDGSLAAPVRVDDPRKAAPWLGRFLVFQATPVPRVARELSRVYGIPVEVTDSALTTQSVTGWYDGRPFDDVFEIVCGVLQAQCAVEDGVAKLGG
jgi:ferric-dicitrate binding protein FerR (iron transport regulator)